MDYNTFISQCTSVQPLAQGGQKAVIQANHKSLGPVVVKRLLHPDNALSIERFRRELRAVALIESPNIPRILEYNVDCDPSLTFFAEQYISGQTLRQLFSSGVKFTTKDLIQFLETMLDVLVRSEHQHIVHRDIKPENIIRDDQGNFWILDFGISRHLDLNSITPDNIPFGLFTLGYAASEQFRSLKKQIDIRSDLFSVGVVATELCLGINPYVNGAQNYQTVLKRIESQALPLLTIDGDKQFQLATFIRMIGDNRQTRRPRTAQEAKEILKIVKASVQIGG